jgi:hypothetical protein
VAQSWAVCAGGSWLDDSNGSGYTRPGVTLTSNRVAVMFLLSFDAGGAAAAPSSVTDSLGNVWTKPSGGETLSGTNALSVWTAHITTGGTATITISHPSTHEGIVGAIVDSADVDSTTRFVGVPVTDSGSSGLGTTLTLPAFASATNVNLACVFHQANEATAPGGGETELADVAGFLQPPSTAPRGLQVQWLANDTTSVWTWATNTSWKAIGLEMQSGVSSGAISFPTIASGHTVRTFSTALASTGTAVWSVCAVCGGGACNGGDCSPYNDQRVVAWGDLGGPWYSSDGGSNWDRCAGGLNDQSPQHTGGDVEWSKDSNFPNRVWSLTSGGFMVSNSWPPTWNVFKGDVQGGEHGGRPRVVGGMVHDTGNSIVYVCEPATVWRYNVPAGASGADSSTSAWQAIATGLARANGICADPNDDGTVWFTEGTFGEGQNSGEMRQITNADTRTTAASTQVAGTSTVAHWDVDAIDEDGTTAVYVAAGTAKVRRYVPSTGSWSNLNNGSLPSGNYCAVQARRIGSGASATTRVVVGIDNSVQSGGNFQQYFVTDDAEATSPTWVCLSLDNANMDLVTTEGPSGEEWIGYKTAANGGSYGNKFRDESTHTPHDMAMSADGRYVYAFTTGGCYRMDLNLKKAYPMMHKLGTTTKGSIRCHPTQASKAAAANTDHGIFLTADKGVTWFKDERGATQADTNLLQGVKQGTAICYDPGSTTRTFMSGGNRNANTGGFVMVSTDPFTSEPWASIGWPVGVQAVGMDARRVGSRIYLFAAGLNSGMKRWDAPTTAITNAGGSWTSCTGTAFSSGGGSLAGDVWWMDDDLVMVFDKQRGIYRCTNPTAATPSFTLVHTIVNDTDRQGFARPGWADTTGNTVIISSDGNPVGAFKITDFRTRSNGDPVTTLKRADGGNFVRTTVMATARTGGKVVITEAKSTTGADAKVYRGNQTGTGSGTLSEDITTQWFGDNHAKQSDADITADGQVMLICGRGGGVWKGSLTATATPDDQAASFSKITSTPTVRPFAVALGPPPSQGIEFAHIPSALDTNPLAVAAGPAPTQDVTFPTIAAASVVRPLAALLTTPPASQGVSFPTIAAASAAYVFAAADPQPPASQAATFNTIASATVVRSIGVAVGPAPSQGRSFPTIAAATVVRPFAIGLVASQSATFTKITVTPTVRPLAVAVGPAPSQAATFGTIAAASTVHALDVSTAAAAFVPFNTIAAATAIYEMSTVNEHVATVGRIVGVVNRRERIVATVTRGI